jgi:hypothetical protein
MRKKTPPAHPVMRRIHAMVPGTAQQSTARRLLKQVYDERGATFNGHYAKAILKLCSLGLVRYDLTWNRERKCTDWHVRLTRRCSQALSNASRGRNPAKSVS